MAFWKFTGPAGTVYPQLGGLTVNTGDVVDFGTYVPSDGLWNTDAGPATVVTGLNFPGAQAVDTSHVALTPFTAADANTVVYSGPTATTATAGTNGAVPAAVAGYLTFQISGTSYKIPYFAN